MDGADDDSTGLESHEGGSDITGWTGGHLGRKLQQLRQLQHIPARQAGIIEPRQFATHPIELLGHSEEVSLLSDFFRHMLRQDIMEHLGQLVIRELAAILQTQLIPLLEIARQVFVFRVHFGKFMQQARSLFCYSIDPMCSTKRARQSSIPLNSSPDAKVGRLSN